MIFGAFPSTFEVFAEVAAPVDGDGDADANPNSDIVKNVVSTNLIITKSFFMK
jgi:hypothetical protein